MPPGLEAITAAPMPAHRDEWEYRVLAHPRLLREIAEHVDGPFHLLYPERVTRNIRSFQRVFAHKGVVGAIYYGKKANKSPAIVRACVAAGVGVDVSSPGELRAALRGGVAGRDLMVTGPAKSYELLVLAARHEAVIAIGDLDELAHLAALGLPARIVLRALPPHSTSRFGMTGNELDLAALTLVHNSRIRLEGYSFHLRGYEVAARAELAADLIRRCREARVLGHPVTTLSIGGGFGVDYVPAAAWKTFRAGVNPEWFHAGHAPRPDSYYPYHCPVPGAAMLAAILDHGDLAAHLRAAGIRLAIEPGRALLDRAGSTVFAVQGVKTRTAEGHPYRILTVNGTSLSVSEQWFGTEYLPDPVLWPELPGTVTPSCVGGASCLEDDMISWRRIPLPRPAEKDDLLIYPNTAGYQMDSNESEFHELPIPPKVVLRPGDGERPFIWEPDGP
ncbi:Y4yA family PLP-dependent enzyme [Nocardia acidivorans]|uniref:Y4yA family PLP-dependent enzyme n=1 Tax=Nocardia acidivorans TaxID=404580 RepID=UPI000A4A7D95|nr:Y4yA family PLP-dependent enzyme [Nocardia acidivorans]